MKRIRELLKEKRWRWTAGGVACLLVAALMFGMLSELGVKADEISLGNDTIDLHPVEGEENTYWLENASQLQKLGNAVSGTEGLTFRLKNDIAMGSIKSPATGNFAGVLDGNGYVITYEDIDIVVTDEVASSDSVENGLMFGSVSGTIQNLVIDIQDTDASYTRKTKNPYNELVGSPVFAEEQNPIIGENEVVSGLSSDMAELQKGGAIHALDTVAGTDYKSHTLSEAGTVTTIYTAGDSSEDYFGLICGKNTGTIQQVYLTGNSVAVQREELAALDYSKSVQSGYREETYYYLQEIDSSTGEAETAQLSIDGTVYAGNETYTEELKDQELVVSVSAPKAAAKGEMITYQITVKNDSDEAYTGVSVLAAADGTEIWQHSFSGEIGAGDTAEAEFSYDTSGLDPEEISVDFTVEGTSGSTAASVTVSDVQTVLFDAAESAFSGSVQGLKLHVSAPEKAGMGDEIGYTVQVTNHADETYSKVLLESVLSGTWEDADQNTAFTGNPEIELASQETRTFTFIYDTGSLSSAETAVTADFTATAVTASETESAKAVVNGLETELVKTVDGVYENSVLGLGMKITAPQAKGVNGTAAIQYEIQISNTSDTAYTGLKVTASEAGAWSSADSSGAGQASTVYELDELAPQTSETITFTYTTTADDLTAAKALLDFKVSGKKDGAEAEVRVSDVETELFDVNSTTEGSSDAELEVKILAPKSVKQGEEVTYAVTVLNLSDKAFDKVVLEADTAGEWTEGAELSSLEPGVEQTVHFTVKNTAAVSNALAVNFTAVGTRTVIIESDTTDPDAAEGSDTATETETQEETVIVKVTNVTTRLFSEAEFSKEEALDGLEIKVLAPQEKVTNWRRTIQYQIVVTNHGEETYEKVKLTASESGRWNGSLFKSATEFEIDGLSAGESRAITYVYSYGDASEVSLSFTASGETTAATVSTAVAGIVTQILDDGEAKTDASEQGLALQVSAPKYSKKGDTLTYTVTVINQSDQAYQQVQLASTGTDGWWSESELSSLEPGEDNKKTVTYTQPTTANAPDEMVLKFSATGVNTDTSETVKAEVSDVTTTLYDAQDAVKEAGVKGLILSISAPQVAKKGKKQSVEYTITISNPGTAAYEGVELTAAKDGRWNDERATTNSYTVGGIAGNSSAEVTFSYTLDGESVSMEFSVQGTAADDTSSITVSGIETQLVKAAEAYQTINTDNGLTATFEVENKNIIEGESFQYTLTLENTNQVTSELILSRDIVISPNLSTLGWKLQSSTAPEFSLESVNQVIPAGKKVVLTKTVTSQTIGESLSAAYKEELELTAVLIVKGYKYTYDKAKSTPESDVFIAYQTAPVTSDGPVMSGNVLYAGAIAGESTGTLSSVKQAVDLTTAEQTAELFLGGIAGTAENTETWSDLYVLGTVNGTGKYLGSGDADVQNSAMTEAEAAALGADSSHTAWASYTKYTTSDGADPAIGTYGDLSWLIKETVFEIGELDAAAIPVTVPEDSKVRDGDFHYAVAYEARKTMQQGSEAMIYVDEQIVLEESAFYKLHQTYATDGYYHYFVQEDTDAPVKFPYDNDVNPYAGKDAFTWEIIRRLIDGTAYETVQVKLPSKGNGYSYTSEDKLYYSVNVPAALGADEAVLPVKPVDGAIYCETSIDYTVTGKYYFSYLNFDIPEIRYGVTPYVDGHIYPMIISDDFGPASRTALEPPKITVFDYYNIDGAENAYAALADQGTYDAGSSMKMNISELSESYDPSFGYVFSKTAPEAGLWETVSADSVTIQKYTGSESLNGFEFETYNGKSLQVIDGDGSAEAYYLYVKGESKYHTEVYYCYGPFYIAEPGTIKGEIYGTADNNASAVSGDAILEGDFMCLETDGAGALNSTSLQYLISDTEITNFAGQSWTNYTSGSFISLMRKSASSNTIYVYARAYQPAAAQTKYGAITGWKYQMQSNSADVKAAPATISYLDGGTYNINAAATLDYNGTVALSAADGSQIYYVQTESEGDALQIERVGTIPDTLGDGYFMIGGRCYHIYAGSQPAELYSSEEQIAVSNDTRETKELHLSVVAIKEGYNPSTTLNYVYKVGEQQQVAAPESALVTNRIENGTETEGKRADISRGATLFFTSMTPNAELYYWIGKTAEGEGTKYENGVKVITTGTTYVITLVAKDPTGNMLDSEPVTFVYNITEAQQTDAPTATPVTSEVSPAVVIPGDKILLSSPTTGAVIYYALGGADPVLEEDTETGEYTLVSGQLYEPEKGITMPEEQSGFFTISAVAVKSGLAPSQVVHFSYAYPSSVQAPYASVNNGSVEMDTEVILKNRTEGAVIYYTMAYDGKVPEDPTISSSVFDAANPFVINRKITIKAMAVKDRVYSEIVTFTYNPYAQIDPPTASIESGSVVSGGTILTLKAAAGATIYYTMDGSDPKETGNAAVMTGTSVILNGDGGSQVTIKAYASLEGKSDSEAATFTYLFSQNPGGVTADVETGSLVSNGSKVNLMTDVTGAEIYYTTNGDSPVTKGTKGTSVTVEGTPGTTFTIKAVAVLNGTPGTVSSFTYKIKDIPNTPSATPGGGVLTVAARVSLSSNVEKIYYTTDGSEPTKSSTPYTEPILINRTTTLKAIAVSEDGEISEIGTYTYYAAEKAAAVTSTGTDGAVLEPGESIRLSTATTGAVIYYSTDGTEPTLDNLDQMLVYDGEEIEINRSVTIQAVAYRDDLRLSDVESWNYVVEVIPAVEQKKAEEAKKAEEGLRDTDATALARSTEETPAQLIKRCDEGELETLISYRAGALPEGLRLETIREENSPLAIEKAKGLFGDDHTVLESYLFKVKRGTTPVQPQEEVEIAVPIPEAYEDAVLRIAYVEDGHNLTTLETRREDGMLYAKTKKLGSYVIIGPEREENFGTSFPYLLLLEIAAGAALFFGLIYLLAVQWKKYQSRRKNYPKE